MIISRLMEIALGEKLFAIMFIVQAIASYFLWQSLSVGTQTVKMLIANIINQYYGIFIKLELQWRQGATLF